MREDVWKDSLKQDSKKYSRSQNMSSKTLERQGLLKIFLWHAFMTSKIIISFMTSKMIKSIFSPKMHAPRQLVLQFKLL